jgi:glycosyltransferase involved in cell wall biosynthesis
MKKVLVASYYFPPCNIISAQRARSFADNFKQHGLYPVVVTRHWTGDENSTDGYESENLSPPSVTEYENYTLVQLPYRAQLDRSYHRPLLASRFGKLLLYTGLYAAGTVNPKCNAYANFYDHIVEYLSAHPVDYILATAFPMNTIKLGHILARKFNVPFIADFRDLWDNRLLSADYRPPPAARIQNFFYESYLKKWLGNADLITAVSQPLADEAKRLAPHAKTLVVTNGFEAHLFAEARRRYAPPAGKFVFSVIGTLEPQLDLSVMTRGLNLFLRNKDLSEIELNFVGSGVVPEVKRYLAAELPPECTNITDRIARTEAIRKMIESHVLFHAGWRGLRGIASGKLYEYLGAGRNVLIAPGDRDVMERIVTETGAGRVADSPEQFAGIMDSWFAEWKKNGTVEYGGIDEKIRVYTREKQAEKLASAILSLEQASRH